MLSVRCVFVVGLVFAMLSGCAAPNGSQQAPAAGPAGQLHNGAFKATMTCGEFNNLRQSAAPSDKSAVGVAILWLDGVYAGRSGITEYPEGWSLTVSQGVGANCAIRANETRHVLDIIAELHRQLYRSSEARPPA